MTFKRVGLALAVLLVAVVFASAYMGLFATITVSEGVAGPFTFVYRDMRGSDMSEVGAITTALDTALQSAGIEHRQPLDVFFPDGRAEIGFAITRAPVDALARLGPDVRQRTVPAVPVLLTDFPRRNRVSFIIGAAKVDRAFGQYRSQHGYAKTEAYTLNDGDTIRYFQRLAR